MVHLTDVRLCDALRRDEFLDLSRYPVEELLAGRGELFLLWSCQQLQLRIERMSLRLSHEWGHLRAAIGAPARQVCRRLVELLDLWHAILEAIVRDRWQLVGRVSQTVTVSFLTGQ